MPSSPLALRFVIVAGKGGVGRSAASAALALSLARQGRRVLVAMCNAKERLSYLLETDPIGPDIRRIAPNIDAVNMEPEAALEEYGMMVLKVRALYKLVFENRFVAAFLRGTPGLEAWSMLGKAQYHAFEQDASGSARYDTVIVDAPATGHGLDLLRVPKVILDVVPPGPLRKDAERAWELFRDPTRAGVLLVTIPEELPTNETIELHQAVTSELGLPVCGLVTNMVLPRLFEDDEPALLERAAREVGQDSPAAEPLEAAHMRAERETIQAACIERLEQAIPAPRFELPLL
ncbi:MAG: anion-transporting ATPase, partial [Myxococcales bacterium]|nr:anion-transporting ATPase [Myxococcales bacterium]